MRRGDRRGDRPAEAAVLDDDAHDVLRLAAVGRRRVDRREAAEQRGVLLVGTAVCAVPVLPATTLHG